MIYNNYVKIYKVKESAGILSTDDTSQQASKIVKWLKTLTYPLYKGTGNLTDVFDIEQDDSSSTNIQVTIRDKATNTTLNSGIQQLLSSSKKAHFLSGTSRTSGWGISLDNLVLFYYIRDTNNQIIDFIGLQSNTTFPTYTRPAFCKFSGDYGDGVSIPQFMSLINTNTDSRYYYQNYLYLLNKVTESVDVTQYHGILFPPRNEAYSKILLLPVLSQYVPKLDQAFFVQGTMPTSKSVFKLGNNYYLMIWGGEDYLLNSGSSSAWNSQDAINQRISGRAGICMQIKLTEEDEKEEEESSN